MTTVDKLSNKAYNLGILEFELERVEKQIKDLDREQKQLLQWALKGFPEETVETENKRINNAKAGFLAQKSVLESQIEASREAAINVPKLEKYIDSIRGKLTTLNFDMKRLALDMLNIKVFIDGESVEITGTIPVEDVVVPTKSS